MDERALFLGVDGGSSHTRALLVDGCGGVRGYGTGGNANHQGQGFDRALRHVAAAVNEALAAAQADASTIALAHLALAGDDTVDDDARLTAGLRDALPGLAFRLSNDVWAGLWAGSPDGVGVAVNCGSGCGTVGRNARGDQVMIADLGYQFGDSGGGIQIAIDAVRAVIRAWDGRGPATALTALILAATAQPSVDALYLALYREQIDRARLRAATRLVFEAAAAGDGVARAILRRIGDELGVGGAAVARRLGLGAAAFPLVLTGGAFRTLASPLAEAAIARVRQDAPRCRATLPLVQPVAGAALAAIAASGRAVARGHYAALQRQGFGWHPEETFT